MKIRIPYDDLEPLSLLVVGLTMKGGMFNLMNLGLADWDKNSGYFVTTLGEKAWKAYNQPRNDAEDKLRGYVDVEVEP